MSFTVRENLSIKRARPTQKGLLVTRIRMEKTRVTGYTCKLYSRFTNYRKTKVRSILLFVKLFSRWYTLDKVWTRPVNEKKNIFYVEWEKYSSHLCHYYRLSVLFLLITALFFLGSFSIRPKPRCALNKKLRQSEGTIQFPRVYYCLWYYETVGVIS